MRNRVATVGVSGVLMTLLMTLAACNSFDEPGVEGNAKLVIPVDSRVATQALTKLPPISGGTLAVGPDGVRAVASDPIGQLRHGRPRLGQRGCGRDYNAHGADL